MTCPTCGKELPENTKFCVFCGSRIVEPEAEPEPTSDPATPAAGDTLPPPPPLDALPPPPVLPEGWVPPAPVEPAAPAGSAPPDGAGIDALMAQEAGPPPPEPSPEPPPVDPTLIAEAAHQHLPNEPGLLRADPDGGDVPAAEPTVVDESDLAPGTLGIMPPAEPAAAEPASAEVPVVEPAPAEPPSAEQVPAAPVGEPASPWGPPPAPPTAPDEAAPTPESTVTESGWVPPPPPPVEARQVHPEVVAEAAPEPPPPPPPPPELSEGPEPAVTAVAEMPPAPPLSSEPAPPALPVEEAAPVEETPPVEGPPETAGATHPTLVSAPPHSDQAMITILARAGAPEAPAPAPEVASAAPLEPGPSGSADAATPGEAEVSALPSDWLAPPEDAPAGPSAAPPEELPPPPAVADEPMLPPPPPPPAESAFDAPPPPAPEPPAPVPAAGTAGGPAQESGLPPEPESPIGIVDPHGIGVLVSRMEGADRLGAVALAVLTTLLREGEVVEHLVVGQYQNNAGLAALTQHRVLLVNDHQWKPDIRELPVEPGLVVQGWMDEQTAAMQFESRGFTYTIQLIPTQTLARDFALAMREKVHAVGG